MTPPPTHWAYQYTTPNTNSKRTNSKFHPIEGVQSPILNGQTNSPFDD